MTATLTSNLKSYNEEQIKQIQLSAIGDKQREAITDKAYAEIASPAPVDLSQKPMERTGNTVTIGDPAKATHEVEITLSDEEYDALMQAVPESKPQDAYNDLETALATANVSVKNGYRFDVRFTPGANIYTGSIEIISSCTTLALALECAQIKFTIRFCISLI